MIMDTNPSITGPKPLHRGGRPHTANPRRRVVGVRFSDAELAEIQSKISVAGLRHSEAVRLLLLNDVLPTKVFGGTDVGAARAYQNLQPLQSNLNQLAKHMNSDRTAQLSQGGAAKLWDLLKSIEREVKVLRSEVITGGEHPASQEAS